MSDPTPSPFLDLAPARWIWLPCQRTLQNTVALFRREIDLAAPPRSVRGWIVADSRYRLLVNGERMQWGPAPSDPRDQEADPLDLTAHLTAGRNVLGVAVLYFGTGDGTWACGSPGLLINLEIEHADGRRERIVSDAGWRCTVDRAWRPGQYKRWYLRAQQEIVDSSRHPHGWDRVGFDDQGWAAAAELPGAANRPSLMAGARDYQYDATLVALPGVTTGSLAAPGQPDPLRSPCLRRRTLPLLDESTSVEAVLSEAGTVRWLRHPDDWFEFRMAGSLEAVRGALPAADADGGWTLPATPEGYGRFLTFALSEQTVGWPRLAIEAPAGTVVDLIYQEGHDPQRGPAWLESYFHNWSRLICRGGHEEFETFDFESLRWIQLHIRNPAGPVRVRAVGLRRRRYPWPQAPVLRSAEPVLDRLFAAAINTMANAGQDQFYDGGGRERQQYSGDCGHQLTAWRQLTGDRRLPARFLRTWGEGQTSEGWFLDCWPAYDRLNRLAQRTVGVTPWGPLVDHGVGYVFDHHQHWLETGDLAASRESWPRLKVQMAYFRRLAAADGLLPVENLGLPAVWIDHLGFPRQRHKQCAFNLYAAAMLTHAMAPLARAFGEASVATEAEALGARILAAAIARFWDADSGLFVDNLPWLAEEGAPHTHDRALATAVLFGQIPGGRSAAIADELVRMPERCGPSYPPNAGWRYHALAALGRQDVVVRELRERWAAMPSVVHNLTLCEDWHPQPDSTSQWSHCPLAPFNVLLMDVVGLRPTAPGYAGWTLRPRLADLADLTVDIHTVGGAFRCRVATSGGKRTMTVAVPAGVGPGNVILPDGSRQDAAAGATLSLAC